MFLYLWKGAAPELTITGDAANIASFAAAKDHPGMFAGDELLGDHDNFTFYRTIHIPLLRWFSKYAGGYGKVFLWLSWPHMLLQAIGFYLLGFVVFRVRIWAAIFSFVSLWFGMIWSTGEFWGIYKDPLPRVSFQALLPFLLAASYCWRRMPGRWPWLMAAAGALTYVHPPSAPVWGFALWCGFLFYAPGTWSKSKKMFYMLFTGGVFLIVMGPFYFTYLGTHSHGAAGNYDKVFPIMLAIYDRGLLDIPYAIGDFIYTISFKFGHGTAMIVPALLLPGAICGFVFLKRFKQNDAGSYKIVTGWLIGLFFASAVLPFIEHEICRRFRMIPYEISFIRGMRYIVPLCMLFCVWPLAEFYKRCESEITKSRILGIAVIISALWAATHLPPGVAGSVYHAVASRQFAPVVANQGELKEAMDFIRDEVPTGARVFAPPGRISVAVRYYAFKPVVYSYKDRGPLAFTSHAGLIEWNKKRLRLESILAIPPEKKRLSALMKFAVDCGADYLFVNFDAAQIRHDKTRGKIMFRNKMYSVYKLHRDSFSKRTDINE